jgi:hypothetical protein
MCEHRLADFEPITIGFFRSFFDVFIGNQPDFDEKNAQPGF